jgi:hypothetical protein
MRNNSRTRLKRAKEQNYVSGFGTACKLRIKQSKKQKGEELKAAIQQKKEQEHLVTAARQPNGGCESLG